MVKIQVHLLSLLGECLGELAREFKSYANVDQAKLTEQILTREASLLPSFQSQLKEAIGAINFHFSGSKVKALLKNVEEVKVLLATLLNRSCVQFLVQFKMLRTCSDEVERNQFSIFRHGDSQTHRVVEEVYELAKARVYRL